MDNIFEVLLELDRRIMQIESTLKQGITETGQIENVIAQLNRLDGFLAALTIVLPYHHQSLIDNLFKNRATKIAQKARQGIDKANAKG